MNANALAVKQYAQMGVQTGVESASPHRLIQMLLDGALARIVTAGGHLKHGNMVEKGAQISWAISIIAGLRGSLNMRDGGELAQNLDALYDYVSRRLFEANLKNDPEKLTEAYTVLNEIRDGWNGIADTPEARGHVPHTGAMG